jgi:gamma-glutamylputrescine oxidase
MQWQQYIPQDQVFWYLKEKTTGTLTHDITTDVVIIGGGMAGLSAAQAFHKKGLRVVLIEQNYCGSGASGKSSGFITPDSELSLHELAAKFGMLEAKKMWDFITSGVELIRANIQTYNIACDYLPQDTLIVATSSRAFKDDISKEHFARLQAKLPSSLYSIDQLELTLPGGYKGGMSYGGTFGIQGYHYCQAMKRILSEQGVEMYEETPAIRVEHKKVYTPHASIKADYIIVCADRFAQGLPSLQHQVYHAQTVLMLSERLSQQQITTIFPEATYMVWDTDLVYQYYRLNGDNRLMVGGSNLWTAFATQEKHHNTTMIKKLQNYMASRFPKLSINFEYVWPGMIGISKDILPIAGFDAAMPSVYYITGAAGLPWAAALGQHSARHILEHDTTFATQLSPYRKYPISPFAQRILGNRLTFILSNMLTVASI